MARRMADTKFRKNQLEHRYDEHIAPFNRLVDELRNDNERGWAPYIAPMYGGVKARLLSILRDPGPKTQDNTGSGFLCMENDDPTAEALCRLFVGVGIGAEDIVPWNAYPWYINRKPKAAELDAGVEPMRKLIELLPYLQVVMLHGGDALSGWNRLTRRYPKLLADRNLSVISTYHTSSQAFITPDPAEREARKEHLRESFREAARCLKIQGAI